MLMLAQPVRNIGKVFRSHSQIKQPVPLRPNCFSSMSARNPFSFSKPSSSSKFVVKYFTRSMKGFSFGSSASTPPPFTMPSSMSAANVAEISRRATPTTANASGSKPSCSRWNNAGSSLRFVKSPDAPKITTMQGSGTRSCLLNVMLETCLHPCVSYFVWHLLLLTHLHQLWPFLGYECRKHSQPARSASHFYHSCSLASSSRHARRTHDASPTASCR